MLLAGDIGGTKCALGLFDRTAGPRAPLRQGEFVSRQFPSLEAVALEFLGQDVRGVESAWFGVAGPVVEGRAKPTNLPWEIEESRLRKALHLSSVRLVNDVQATAQAIPTLRYDEVEMLIEGEAVPFGPVALIAPGTGLGEAFLIWDGERYHAQPSEGGHADFAPNDDEQAELLAYMRKRYDHVSYERVCSGIGIPHIYEFLRDTGYAEDASMIAEALSASVWADRTRIIIDAAQSKEPSALCARTVDVFVSILAAEAGNLALKVVATGGVYLAGGIPRNILPVLKGDSFRSAFAAKGRLSELASRIPVRTITGHAALLGVAISGLETDPTG